MNATRANRKSAAPRAADPKRLAELRRREEAIATQPTAECYLKLAHEYHALGLNKESDRLLQLAEALENGLSSTTRQDHNGLMCGTADPVMLIEVIQILSRTTLTGELIVDTPEQTFHAFFDQGNIINASSQSFADGLESLRRMLQISFGTYRFIKKSVAHMAHLIDDQTEVVLLNVMHDADREAVGHTLP